RAVLEVPSRRGPPMASRRAGSTRAEMSAETPSMRLPRLTTRRLMVLVAVVGIILGLETRRIQFLELASYHSGQAMPTMRFRYDGVWITQDVFPDLPSGTKAYRTTRSEWHAGLADKYARAARYPWLPVPHDPPPPD